MSDRLRSLMVGHGALVFLVGMAAGFPFAFVILGKVVLWPFPGALDWTGPGDVRAWRPGISGPRVAERAPASTTA